MSQSADVMPNVVKKETAGSGVPRPTANISPMSKLRQSGARFLHKTAQRLSLREDSPDAPEPASANGPAESNTSGNATQQSGPSSRQDRSSPSSSTPPSRPTTHSKQSHTSSAVSTSSSKPERSPAAGPSARQDRPQPSSSASKTLPAKKAVTPQPEPRPAAPLKRRSASTDAATSTAVTKPRASAVRQRDRPRDGSKVCFAPRVQLLGPSESEERQERDESPLAEEQERKQEQEQVRQAESMRKLEQENESLRHAIENYRELERRRAAGGSSGGGSANGQDAGGRGQEESTEDAEEDEVEKAVEVSPSGVFLKFNEEIGRGSFKAVYKGLDTTTGVFVAWCELQLSGNRLSKKERDRFREEAGLMKGLTHPNIVRFYDFWEVDRPKRSCIVLVTELMTSGTLRTYLKNFGQKRVSLKIIKQWCRQILRGLQFLHSRNPPIIHRDLKCDNIFISGTTGQVKVGDLGLATLKNRSFAKSVIGTPEFMAPEVYEEHYDEAVDVYAFGMCMLEMVTSEYPYSECTGPAQIYKKVITGIKPSSFDKIDDTQTRELIEWCTRLNSKERPTVKQLLNHEFFAEDCGMRLDVANREEAVSSSGSVIHLQLRVVDAKKRRDTHKENEAIQFNYVLNKDNPEETAKQMVMSGLLAEENCRPLAKMITNVIQSLVRAREERRRDKAAPSQPQSAPASGVGPGPGSAAVAGGAGTGVVMPAGAPVSGAASAGVVSAPVAPAASVAPVTPVASGSVPGVVQGSVLVPVHVSASLPVVSGTQGGQTPSGFTEPSGIHTAAAPAAAPATAPATQTQSLQQLGGAETAAEENRQAESVVAVAEVANVAQPSQLEVHSDSATGAESDSALSERKEKKGRARRRKTCEKLPRLTVLEVMASDNGPVVSCLLETNQSRAITFKFDLHEADADAISYKMTEAHQLLPKDDAQYFEEQLRAVIRQQRELRTSAASQPPQTADQEATAAQPMEEPAVGPQTTANITTTNGNPQRRPTELLPPPPGQAVGRRSRFIVSSVVESRASPMPSPSLQSPASEQPLNMPTAGAATTSVSASPQLAVVSPELLSPAASSSGQAHPSQPSEQASKGQVPAPVAPVSGAVQSSDTAATSGMTPVSVMAQASAAASAPSVTPVLTSAPSLTLTSISASAPITGSTSLPLATISAPGHPVSASEAAQLTSINGILTPTTVTPAISHTVAATSAVTAGSLQTAECHTRPSILTVSPESRPASASAAAAAPVTSTPSQRHVRFAVTPTVFTPENLTPSVSAVAISSSSNQPVMSTFPSHSSVTGQSPQQQVMLKTSAVPLSSTASGNLSTSTPVTPSSSAVLSTFTGAAPMLSPVAISPALSPTGVMDSTTPTSAGPTYSAAAAATAGFDASRVNGLPSRPVNGAQPPPVSVGMGEDRQSGAGAQEQPTSPLDTSMGNLAQLAKQLTRLTSQPAEGAGSGTQTPAEGVSSARRLTASGTGTTQTQRAGLDPTTSAAPPLQRPPPQPPTTAAGSPADPSRSSSAADAAAAAERRKPLPLLLSDLAKALNKLHVKPAPAGGAGGGVGAGAGGVGVGSVAGVVTAAAQTATASTAVQTSAPSLPATTPQDTTSAVPPSVQPAASSGPPPEPPRTGPADTTRSRPQGQAENQQSASATATEPAVNGTATGTASPDNDSRPVRKGRFAISKATTDRPPTAAAPAPAAPTARETASVEDMALYRELLARQQTAMAELLRQQEAERDNLRRQLRQQQRQQLQQQQDQQHHPPAQSHPPCTENGTA